MRLHLPIRGHIDAEPGCTVIQDDVFWIRDREVWRLNINPAHELTDERMRSYAFRYGLKNGPRLSPDVAEILL